MRYPTWFLAVVASGLGCDATGKVRDLETLCSGFEGVELSGEYDTSTSTGTPTIFQMSSIILDRDPSAPAEDPYPLREAPVELWVAGGLPYGDPARSLAVCLGSDCAASTDPARWPRTASTKTGGNGVLVFAAFVGFDTAGQLNIEFDNATCQIAVKSAVVN